MCVIVARPVRHITTAQRHFETITCCATTAMCTLIVPEYDHLVYRSLINVHDSTYKICKRKKIKYTAFITVSIMIVNGWKPNKVRRLHNY